METKTQCRFRKGNMWVKESMREQEGGRGEQERRTGVMLKWVGLKRPAMTEGEK